MKCELVIPIEWLKGKVQNDGYYFRLYRGQQIVQKCPSQWKDTPARKAAREKFAATWGQRYKKKEEPHVKLRENEENRHGMPDN